MERIYANLLPLWDDIGVMQRGTTWEKQTSSYKKDDNHEDDSNDKDEDYYKRVEELKQYRGHKKRENNELQKRAEQIESNNDISWIEYFSLHCNASLRHLATFINIIEQAKEDNKSIGLATFKRRMKDTEVKNTWKLIRRWLSDNVGSDTEIAVAVSIGRTNKGWYFLKALAVGDNANDFMGDFWHYLKRRNWKSKEVYVNEESNKLLKYYSSKDINDFLYELFGIFRMSLMVGRRTYKNNRASKILESRKLTVEEYASYLVNANAIYLNSPSGVALCTFEKKRNRVVDASSLVDDSSKDEDDDFWPYEVRMIDDDDDSDF